MPLNHAQLLHAYKEQNLEQQTTVSGQNLRAPKEGKEMEWLLFNIWETLQAINNHLARMANKH